MRSSHDFHKPLKLGKHLIPGIWRSILPEEVSYYLVPEECQATCGDCPKIKTGEFHPVNRCCTYIPRVPNFLCGLAFENPTTKPAMRRMIAQQLMTPEGLLASPGLQSLSAAMNSEGRFGANDEVVCDFLARESGHCGLYAYRNSVCSTFFCINDQGDVGLTFWDALQSFMGQIETALSQWCMDRLDLSTAAYFERFDALGADISACHSSSTRGWSTTALAKLWDAWFDRQEEFFLSCAELVKTHSSGLYQIACEVELRTCDGFERAFRAELESNVQFELNTDAPIGTPVSIEDLWYKLQLAHRNLLVRPT